MELKQIETFLQVVADGNMSKAADALYITQSTVSYRLRTLENELGTVLIKRKKGTQNITLTPSGKKFIPLAQEWFAVYRKTQAFCAEDKTTRLCVAAPESINFLLREAYKRLRQQEPQVSLTVITANSEQIIQMMRQKKIDIGFSYLPFQADGVETIEVGSFPLTVVECAPKRDSYPLISPEDLDIQHAVMIMGIGMENPNTAGYFTEWFPNQSGFHLRLDSTAMLQSNMTAGDWCLLPALEMDWLTASPQFHVYHFKEPAPRLPYYTLRPPKMDSRIASLVHQYFP